MTLFKNQQRDPVTFWGRVRGFFGAKCPSHIRFPSDKYSKHCRFPEGHAGKHQDGGEIRWGYGDEYFGDTPVDPPWVDPGPRQECDCPDCMEPGLR